MKRLTLIATLAATALLAACQKQPEIDPCLSATDIKQCEAIKNATGGGSSNSDALLYGAGGYMLGSMLNSGGSRHTTVVQKHYYRPSYRPSYRSSWGGSSYRSSSFGRSSFRSGGFGRR